jgi:hypothetical protein
MAQIPGGVVKYVVLESPSYTQNSHTPCCDAKISSQVSIQSWPLKIQPHRQRRQHRLLATSYSETRNSAAGSLIEASHPACAAMHPRDEVCSTEKMWCQEGPCSLDAAQAACEERSVPAPWGCQQEHHARKFRHARAPGAANMCCTSRSFARNTATIRPDKLGWPVPTDETGPKRECAPRAKP